MFFIVVAVILSLVIVGGLLAAFATKTVGGFVVAGLAVALLVLLTIFSSATKVDARAVGIVTSFGKYQSTLNSGLHWTAPWASVEQFETTLQSTDLNDLDGSKNSVYVAFSAPKNVDANGNPVADQKSVAGGGNGNINAVVRWSINPDQSENGAKALWEKYRTFERVSNELVLSESQDKIADVANDFPAGEAAVNQTGIGDEVKKRLDASLSKYGIVVDSVSVKRVSLDAATNASLQRIVDNINKTTAAQEEQKRAKIDNETAALRQKTGALSAQANERYCLDIVNNWDANKNGALPATFNCGLGDKAAGVLVNAK